MLNIDAYNRKRGVEGTNDILRKVFQVMKYCAGSQSFITRKSGGHFYIALKGSEIFEIRNMVKLLNHTIVKSLSEERISESGGMLQLGVTSFPEDSGDLWELFEKVEKKLKKIID